MSDWKSDYVNFHTRLRLARLAKKLTQIATGQLIGVSERTYRDFEAGRIDLPTAKAFRLANALGIRIIISDGVTADGVD